MVDIDDTLYACSDLWVDLFRSHASVDIGPLAHWDWWRRYMRPADFNHLVREHLHSPWRIRANVPFAGAGVALRTWTGRGVEIHIVSQRAPESGRATRAWLREHELPFKTTVFAMELDKVAYCVDHEISLMIDDKPDTISRGLAAGLTVATIVHPYNWEVLAEHPEVIRGSDWYELRTALETTIPALGSPARQRAARRAALENTGQA
jgi:hypothetical protein